MTTTTTPPATHILAWDLDSFGFDGRTGILVRHTDVLCPSLAVESLTLPDDPGTPVDCPVCIRGHRHIAGTRITDPAEYTAVRPYEAPRPAGPPRDPEEIIAECAAWLTTLDRKVEVADVTRDRERAADLWLRRYTITPTTFDFLRDVKAKGVRSAGQAKGVLNCWRADLRRPAGAGNGPTDKQVAYLTSLIGEEGVMEAKIVALEVDGWTRSHVSDLIDVARTRARATGTTRAPAAPENRTEAPEGIHYLDGTVYKVQVAVHGSGQKYAKRLISQPGEKATFEYEGRTGAYHRLSEATLMTLEQAVEFGALYGVCCNCGRTLTDEKSIAAGIGPVCATHFRGA